MAHVTYVTAAIVYFNGPVSVRETANGYAWGWETTDGRWHEEYRAARLPVNLSRFKAEVDQCADWFRSEPWQRDSV